MSETELLACPFCDATLERAGSDYQHPDNECIEASLSFPPTPENVAAWNRRAPSPALQQALAERDAMQRRAEAAEQDMAASDLALQCVSVTLGGTDEWSDQANMIYSVRQLADETAAELARLTAALSAETEACADLEKRAHATIFGLAARITEYEMALDDLDAAEAAFKEADGNADMTHFEDQIAEAIMVAVRVRRAAIRQRQGERS